MSSPYHLCRDQVGLTIESSRGESYHAAYLLLTALGDLDDANPAAVTYPNDPVKEVLSRLRARGYRGFMMQDLERLLVPRVK